MASTKLQIAESSIKHALRHSQGSRSNPFTTSKLRVYENLDITESEGDEIVARVLDQKEKLAAGHRKVFKSATAKDTDIDESASSHTFTNKFWDAQTSISATTSSTSVQLAAQLSSQLSAHLNDKPNATGPGTNSQTLPSLRSSRHQRPSRHGLTNSLPAALSASHISSRSSSKASQLPPIDEHDPLTYESEGILGGDDFQENISFDNGWTSEMVQNIEWMAHLLFNKLELDIPHTLSIDNLGPETFLHQVVDKAQPAFELQKCRQREQHQFELQKQAMKKLLISIRLQRQKLRTTMMQGVSQYIRTSKAERRAKRQGKNLIAENDLNRDIVKKVCGGQAYSGGRLRSGRARRYN